ncbi:Cystathionine gamma-synthase [Balamuthia mandrillaris]
MNITNNNKNNADGGHHSLAHKGSPTSSLGAVTKVPANVELSGSAQEETVTVYHHFDREVLTRRSFEDLVLLEEEAELSKLQGDVVDYSRLKYPAVTQDYDALPTFPVRPHFNKKHLGMRLATQMVVFDGCPNDPYHPASMPIYQTATFVQPSATEFGPYDYTRSGNPTRTALETLIAGLENAHSAFAFSSGMAALSTVTRLLKSGEEVLAGTDLYGGMYRLLTKVSSRCGIKATFVDTTDVESVKAALKPNTRLVHIESPSNPLMRITDIGALAKLLHQHNILLSVDCTMMTPIAQRALDLGADIVIHSGTKFLSGHSDVIMGVVCVRTEELAKEIAFFQNAEGTGLSPFDCWLVLRGMKTLSLRVERSQQNALRVAQFLDDHPLIKDVHYAGLPPPSSEDDEEDEQNDKEKEKTPTKKSYKNKEKPWQERDRSLKVLRQEYETHCRQSSGGGCVLSFTTGNVELSRRFVDALRLFKVTVSFGSCNSLVELPCLLSHASIPKDQRTLPEDLVRMSIGIEDCGDIIEDIRQALDKAQKQFNKKETK